MALRADFNRKIDKVKHQIVEYKKGSQRFEILTNPGKVTAFRNKKCSFGDVLATDIIFHDAKKGTVHGEDVIKSSFPDCENNAAVLQMIVEIGNLKLTAKERAAKVEQKKNEMIYYITKNYVDPKTKHPHPRVRIENAFSEMRIRVNADEPAEKQAEDAVKVMRGPILFGKAAHLTGKLSIKYAYSGKCESILNGFRWESIDYGSEGTCYKFALTMYELNNLQEALAKPTQGDYDLVFDQGGTGENSADSTSKKKKKKKKKDKKKKKGRETSI